jgi:PAS domain S-box-containing protein
VAEIREIEREQARITEDKLHFKYLPAYASYLLHSRLEEFVREQIRLSRELELPILKLFEHLGDEEIFKLSLKSNIDNLKIIVENRISAHLTETMEKWKANELTLITKNQIVIEDITVGNYIRRKGYLRFLPFYTSDMEVFTGVLNELDLFILEGETQSFKMIELIRTEELNKHLKFIEKIVQTVPSTVFVFDLSNKKEIYTNIISKNFLGYSRNEFTESGKSVLFEIIHPDDLPVLLEKFDSFHTMKDEDVITFESRAKHKSGDYHWLRNYIRIFKYNEKGVPAQVILASLDVTEEKKIAEVSYVHEKQLLEAQEISQTGSFIWDISGNNGSSYTPQMYRIFEMDKFSDITRFLENVHPGDRDKVQAAMQKALSGKDGLYECEYRYIRNGKEKIIWSRGIVSFENGTPVNMRGTIIDVTARHSLVERLRTSEESYHRMVEEVQDYAILLLNKDGVIRSWNKGAEKIKGYRSDEIIGKNFRLFYTAADIAAKIPEMLLNEAMDKGKAAHEGKRVRKDGTTFWGSILITALHDENNNITGFSKVTRDLSERKKAEDQLAAFAEMLEKKNKELEKSNQELTNFNYISSHDLQEPLRKINTFSNRIIESDLKNLSDNARIYFNRIQTSANRMQLLLNDLLEFSKTHSIEKHFEQCELKNILNELKDELKETLEENNITLRFEKLPVIHAIKFQLNQLFNNIIRNAIKYKRPNVVPLIKIKSSHIRGENMPFWVPDKNIRYSKISISDNGIGFDQKHAEKIFEIFHRLHGKNEYDGTGIGLAICKKIMENHHGYITATGEVNNGARFDLYFPINQK